MESRKMVLKFIYRAAVEKQTQRIDLWTWGERSKDNMYGKSNMETYITICKIDSQWNLFAVGKFATNLQGICYRAQETQTGALYQSRGVWAWGRRWEGGSK